MFAERKNDHGIEAAHRCVVVRAHAVPPVAHSRLSLLRKGIIITIYHLYAFFRGAKDDDERSPRVAFRSCERAASISFLSLGQVLLNHPTEAGAGRGLLTPPAERPQVYPPRQVRQARPARLRAVAKATATEGRETQNARAGSGDPRTARCTSSVHSTGAGRP